LLDETISIYCMLGYFLSPAKVDLLPTDWGGGSSACSDALVTDLSNVHCG